MEEEEIEVSAKDVLPLKIVAIALATGPTLFFGVILFIMQPSTTKEGGSSGAEIITNLSLLLCLVLNSISPIIQKVVTKKALSLNEMTPVNAFQAGMMVRYAMAEGPALMGLVSLLLAGGSGDLWAPTLPLVILYWVILSTFPTASYVEKKLRYYSE
jgi:hypothetical protein